jgi:hypothetical protein
MLRSRSIGRSQCPSCGVPVDMAEAIRQSMAAAKARGGGGGAWRDDNVARPTASGRAALGAGADAVVGASNRLNIAEAGPAHSEQALHPRSMSYSSSARLYEHLP